MDLAELDPEERERWERYILTGIHAFLFVDHVVGDRHLYDIIVEDLFPLIPEAGEPSDGPVVLSASEFVGPYKAFIHLWSPPGQLAALQNFIGGKLWDVGIRCVYATQAFAYQGPDKVYPLKIKKCDVVAVVRIWAEPGCAKGLPAALSGLEGFQGAATVFGDFDVLLVLDGEDFSSVAAVALGPLQEVAGIARSETSFADYRRYDDDDDRSSKAKGPKKRK